MPTDGLVEKAFSAVEKNRLQALDISNKNIVSISVSLNSLAFSRFWAVDGKKFIFFMGIIRLISFVVFHSSGQSLDIRIM